MYNSVDKYEFSACEHPKFVRSKYTGEIINTSCGVCKSCLCKRNSKMAFQCSLEEQDHKYCMFVTLTYDNFHIPKTICRLYESDSEPYFAFYNVTKRLAKYEDIVGWLPVSACKSGKSFPFVLKSKIGLGDYIPYASKVDLQLFLKRFRKNIFKQSHEKIRYYAVSEYGPVHYRPHFHLLLFFDTERTLEAFDTSLHKSWKYGRIDFSLSRGKCSSYVSSYVNSSVSLPRLFENGSFKPFTTHSLFFAKGFYKDKRKEVYENEPERFITQRRTVSSKNVEFTPWRSLTSMFFPRCKFYSRKSYGELYNSYTILRRVKAAYGDRPLPELAEMIAMTDYVSPENQFVYDYFNVGSFRCFNEETVASFISSIASELYISKHFLEFCVPGFSEHFVLRRIIDYYKARDYHNLVERYKNMCDYYEKWQYNIRDPDWWKLFYDNTLTECEYFDKLSKTPAYHNFIVNSSLRYAKSIKHKKLNDLNNIFNEKL